ncbi:MAG: hypothetical protein K0S27_1280 [Gammaproteobacteria bacterium]|jgi:hypothetical protein|nr:hypothetical protein [Gammaproteobacteria bacterium]
MKKLIAVNTARHIFRMLFAVSIALLLNYYVVESMQGWLPFSTMMVMLTSTGSALYQGLQRFFIISGVVIVGSLIFPPFHLLYTRMYYVAIGAVVGILANIIILPDRVDYECRNAFVPILKSYAYYFPAIVDLLLKSNLIDAEREKIHTEKNLRKLPQWVYEVGFDSTLQMGYRYFFMKVGQMGEILFAMHHLARHSFSDQLLNVIREPLLQCIPRLEQFIFSLITVLELKKLREGIVDFEAELATMEEKFRVMGSPLWEGLEGEKDAVYLAEFIYDLRDLRSAMLRLTEALR